MRNNIVVTNLRIDKDDWREIKIAAVEMHLSTNEYIKRVLSNVYSRKKIEKIMKTKRAKSSIWDLPKLASIPKKPMKLSPDDEIIYG